MLEAAVRLHVVLALLIVGTPRAEAQQVFEEFLDDGSANDSGYLGYLQSGSFVAGGWKTTVMDSRIMFDLDSLGEFPNGIACGTAEVEFVSFDPITNFQGDCGDYDPNGGDECYANIIGLYEGDHGSAWTAASNLETQIQVQATCEQCFNNQPGDLGRDRCLKFKGVSADWDVSDNIVNFYLPSANDVAWESHMGRHYIASFTWSCGQVDYSLEFDGTPHTAGNLWFWGTAPAGARPNIRNLFIGKDNSVGDKWIQEVIYYRVKVTRNEPCDCPALPECPNGVIETGEDCEGSDLAGQSCQSLGYAGGALACTGQCAFDVSGCVPFADAGLDASVCLDGGDGGPGADAADTGPGSDTGSGEDSGVAPDPAGSGCGCETQGHPLAGGLPVLLLGILLIGRRQRARRLVNVRE
ncbi:MAG: hypothetical protein RBU30_10285 [Polyangia bacterium]|jgi:MYXO-CTERM domain-containing protein|nr:hypothetical protein [Polyangia bacterium]